MNLEEHLKILGYEVEDKVTGKRGTVDSIAFDLYGCIQAAVIPKVDENGEERKAKWLDVPRLKVISDEPVMDQPDFGFELLKTGKKGSSDKP